MTARCFARVGPNVSLPERTTERGSNEPLLHLIPALKIALSSLLSNYMHNIGTRNGGEASKEVQFSSPHLGPLVETGEAAQ